MARIKERPAGYIRDARVIALSALQPPYVLESVTGRQAGRQAGRQPSPLGRAAAAAMGSQEVQREVEGNPERPRTQGSSDADSDSRGIWTSAGDGAVEPPPAPTARHLPPEGLENIAEDLSRRRYLSRRFCARLSAWLQNNVIFEVSREIKRECRDYQPTHILWYLA